MDPQTNQCKYSGTLLTLVKGLVLVARCAPQHEALCRGGTVPCASPLPPPPPPPPPEHEHEVALRGRGVESFGGVCCCAGHRFCVADRRDEHCCCVVVVVSPARTSRTPSGGGRGEGHGRHRGRERGFRGCMIQHGIPLPDRIRLCLYVRGKGGSGGVHIQHSPGTPTTGLRERGNDTSKSTGRSGRQNAATRRNMRREERVTVQGPVKEQQPDGMSHRGFGGGSGGVPQRGRLFKLDFPSAKF